MKIYYEDSDITITAMSWRDEFGEDCGRCEAHDCMVSWVMSWEPGKHDRKYLEGMSIDRLYGIYTTALHKRIGKIRMV